MWPNLLNFSLCILQKTYLVFLPSSELLRWLNRLNKCNKNTSLKNQPTNQKHIIYTIKTILNTYTNIYTYKNIGPEGGVTKETSDETIKFYLLVEDGNRRGKVSLPGDGIQDFWCHNQEGPLRIATTVPSKLKISEGGGTKWQGHWWWLQWPDLFAWE